MEEVYLMIEARYIELNPVKARLVSKPELWEYSSAALLVNFSDWQRFEDEVLQLAK
jgi:hypothetical protein